MRKCDRGLLTGPLSAAGTACAERDPVNPAWDWEGGGASRTLAVGAHLGPGGSATPKEAPLPAHIFRLCLSGGGGRSGRFRGRWEARHGGEVGARGKRGRHVAGRRLAEERSGGGIAARGKGGEARCGETPFWRAVWGGFRPSQRYVRQSDSGRTTLRGVRTNIVETYVRSAPDFWAAEREA